MSAPTIFAWIALPVFRYMNPLRRPYKPGKMAPVWFTKLVSPPIEPITLDVGPGKLRILPEPSRSVLDAWDDLMRLFWLSLALFVLVNFIVFWFAGRALDPVKDILKGLHKMEIGEFHARLPKFKLREMGAISDTFNRMAQAIEESFAVKRQAEKTALELKENRELTQLIQRHIEEETTQSCAWNCTMNWASR